MLREINNAATGTRCCLWMACGILHIFAVLVRWAHNGPFSKVDVSLISFVIFFFGGGNIEPVRSKIYLIGWSAPDKECPSVRAVERFVPFFFPQGSSKYFKTESPFASYLAVRGHFVMLKRRKEGRIFSTSVHLPPFSWWWSKNTFPRFEETRKSFDTYDSVCSEPRRLCLSALRKSQWFIVSISSADWSFSNKQQGLYIPSRCACCLRQTRLHCEGNGCGKKESYK